LTKREPRQVVSNLHYLLLVNDDAVGLREDWLQLWKVVSYRLQAVLACDEVVDIFHRPRAEQRVQRRQVLQASGPCASQDVTHARRFKLEDAVGDRLGKQLICLLVVKWQGLEIQELAAILAD